MQILKDWPQLHQNKSVQFLQILVPGVIIFDYITADTISQQLGGWFYVLPLALIIMAIVLPVSHTLSNNLKLPLIVLYYFMSALLLLFFTDIFGPYFQILILLLLTAVIWFGLKGMLYSMLLSYLIVAGGVFRQIGFAEVDFFSQIGLYIISLTILGVLFEQVTRRHRHQLEKQSEVNQNYYLERTRLLSLINSMADAVIATDRFGNISLYNGAVLNLFNTNESLHDKNISEILVLKDENDNDIDILQEASDKHVPVIRDDVHFIAQDGSPIDIYINISPVSAPGSSREITGFIVLLRDITKQKTLDEQRDEFISVASHELRTPIAIAEANISTARMPKFSGKMSQEGKKLLTQAHENVLFLSSLINDLHVLAQAEQGRMGAKPKLLNPADFLHKIADEYKGQIEKKGLKLKLETANKLPEITISSDALREIMQNLITNAIKYTEKGTIILGAKPGDGNEEVIFFVKDSGIGISVTDQKHVFEKFYRSEDYRTRKSGGTGLGLYIIKRLTARLGGRLWLESNLNKGSTFYCALPIKPPKNEDAQS